MQEGAFVTRDGDGNVVDISMQAEYSQEQVDGFLADGPVTIGGNTSCFELCPIETEQGAN